MIKQPSYIVAEIPEPVRSQVQALRDALNTPRVKLPVEITLAGSSGVGPIPAGADLSIIRRHLDKTLADFSPFRARFSAIRSFPNTSIFYLEPFDRTPFDNLYDALRKAGIPFSEIQWPYNPHCTIRGGKPLSADAAAELCSRLFPQEEFWINTISVYELADTSLGCKLLYQRTLSGPGAASQSFVKEL